MGSGTAELALNTLGAALALAISATVMALHRQRPIDLDRLLAELRSQPPAFADPMARAIARGFLEAIALQIEAASAVRPAS